MFIITYLVATFNNDSMYSFVAYEHIQLLLLSGRGVHARNHAFIRSSCVARLRCTVEGSLFRSLPPWEGFTAGPIVTGRTVVGTTA